VERKPQTVNGYLRHIKSALTYALDDGLIDKKPKIKMVPEDRQSIAERIISPKDLKTILAAAYADDPDFGRYLTLLLWTGARRREAHELNWQDCDLDNKSAPLTKTKGKRNRRVPLLQPVIDALEPVKKDIGRIFPQWHPDTVSKWLKQVGGGSTLQNMLMGIRCNTDSLLPLYPSLLVGMIHNISLTPKNTRCTRAKKRSESVRFPDTALQVFDIIH